MSSVEPYLGNAPSRGWGKKVNLSAPNSVSLRRSTVTSLADLDIMELLLVPVMVVIIIQRGLYIFILKLKFLS